VADDSKWKARILDKIQKELDPPTQLALAMFYQQARIVIRRLVGAGMSAFVLRMIAMPVVRNAYDQMLASMGVPYQEPSTDFLLKLIDDIVDEVRRGKKS